VCTSDRCCEHQRTHFLHALYRMCICDRCRYLYIYMCIGIFIYVYVYVHVCAYVYVYVSMYVSMCMCMYMYAYICVCIYACVCVHAYVYMCMYIYKSKYILQRVCMHLQVLLSTMHVQVCTLDRCCEHQGIHLSGIFLCSNLVKSKLRLLVSKIWTTNMLLVIKRRTATPRHKDMPPKKMNHRHILSK